MRMEHSSHSSHNADFEQFSKFLNTCPRRAVPCNSANGSTRPTTPTTVLPENHPGALAMVYALKQPWQSIYDPEIALLNGTIFEELDKPFYPTGCNMNTGCRGNNRQGGCTR